MQIADCQLKGRLEDGWCPRGCIHPLPRGGRVSGLKQAEKESEIGRERARRSHRKTNGHKEAQESQNFLVGRGSDEPTFSRSEASRARFTCKPRRDTRFARADGVGSQGSSEPRPTSSGGKGDGIATKRHKNHKTFLLSLLCFFVAIRSYPMEAAGQELQNYKINEPLARLAPALRQAGMPGRYGGKRSRYWPRENA